MAFFLHVAMAFSLAGLKAIWKRLPLYLSGIEC